MKRLVVNTSTSCFENNEVPENLLLLNYHVYVNGGDYIDGETISIEQIANLLTKNPQLEIETSPPSAEEIGDFFYKLMQQGVEEVYVVTISQHLSAAYEHIKSLQVMFSNKMTIHLFDSKSVAFIEGKMAVEAAKMLQEDKSIFEIENHLNDIQKTGETYFVVNDLTRLIKGKRLSAPAGFIANMFSIKPLLYITEEGTIEVFERIRKIEVALEKLCETVIDKANKSGKDICVMSSVNDNLRAYVLNRLNEHGYKKVPVVPFSATVLAHLGSSSIGLSVY